MPTKNEILAVRALRNRKTRILERKFTVEGAKGVEEALKSGWPIHNLLATADADIPEAWKAERISQREMERISNLKTPPGVLAVVGIPDASTPLSPNGAAVLPPMTIALDGLSDPGNLGTIIRSADWFGMGGIWSSALSVDAFNPKVVQATMGAIFRVPVWNVNLLEVLTQYQANGARIIGLEMEGDSLWTVSNAVDERPVVTVLGSESHGLSPEIKVLCTELVHIPGGGQSESLNASVAASIFMAAWTRK